MQVRRIELKWKFLIFLSGVISLSLNSCSSRDERTVEDPGVAVLLVNTDHVTGHINEDIYGQFLEHINHSVVDGLFAEQIRGRGFEGDDFESYWELSGDRGNVGIADIKFKNGEKSLRLEAANNEVGVLQGRLYLEEGYTYNGFIWLKPEEGSVKVALHVKDSEDKLIAMIPLKTEGSDWQELAYSFSNPKTDTQASVEIVAEGQGSILMDYISLMRSDIREGGMMRPDLYQSLEGLKPSFIRWPGGSFASIYKWQDGIGPHVSRTFHPNEIWGGYSDYYGFGTDEFLNLCHKLNAEPMIVLAATSTDAAELEYAMNWVHYLNDPASTLWGSMRASSGHPAPYDVEYFQIDNEPMNHGITPLAYAEIVNVYGSMLREIAPDAKIVACGQKRSNDMNWSKMMIDIAGENFDILGCHNYEYENDNFQTGLQRIEDYLVKLKDYIHTSAHPEINVAVLEWGLCRTYDWRAGLHAAGNLILYEKLSPGLEMSCPALLMRNNTDDPTWSAFIYHDHVSWFPGSGYVVEKLFREHFAERHLASSSGTFSDIEDRSTFFQDISQMKPEDWRPGTVDAIATGTSDGKRLVIKAVNYENKRNLLLIRLQGSTVPENATVKLYTLSAGLRDASTNENPDKIQTIETSMPYTKDLMIELKPYSVVVVEIREG